VIIDTRNPLFLGLAVAFACTFISGAAAAMTAHPFFDVSRFALAGFIFGAMFSLVKYHWFKPPPPPDV
jgi:hypothetical protein